MIQDFVAERVFTKDDQHAFASLSGDRNPMHLDAIAARRTMAGQPVVHGIHLLVWGLDSLFQRRPVFGTVASLSAKFDKMVFLGEAVRVVSSEHGPRDIRLKFQVGTVGVIRLKLTFDEAASRDAAPGGEPDDIDLARPLAEPADLTLDQMEGRCGRVAMSAASDELATMFPSAAKALGADRLKGLACLSYLVGMVCPGMHSIFGGLELTSASPAAEIDGGLRFRVVDIDPRFRRLNMSVSGGGWAGWLIANARPEPTRQDEVARIATKIVTGEFSGVRALVIGGSRGIGEVICKLIAAGGGDVVLTYVVGEDDARRVQADIVGHGGCCDIMRYDACLDPAPQLPASLNTINQLYYLPTPTISCGKLKSFDDRRFHKFLQYYVSGFADLCRNMVARTDGGLSVFYPSSTFVETRPSGMTEYAMAKAAGEILCEDIQASDRRLTIKRSRLPRLSTDQTASLQTSTTDDVVETVLPILRHMKIGVGPID